MKSTAESIDAFEMIESVATASSGRRQQEGEEGLVARAKR